MLGNGLIARLCSSLILCQLVLEAALACEKKKRCTEISCFPDAAENV